MTARVERPNTAILTGAFESTEDTTFEDDEDTFLFKKIPSLDRIVQCCGMSSPLVFFGLHSLVNRCCKTGIPLQLWALSQCRYPFQRRNFVSFRLPSELVDVFDQSRSLLSRSIERGSLCPWSEGIHRQYQLCHCGHLNGPSDGGVWGCGAGRLLILFDQFF